MRIFTARRCAAGRAAPGTSVEVRVLPPADRRIDGRALPSATRAGQGVGQPNRHVSLLQHSPRDFGQQRQIEEVVVWISER